MDAQCFIISLYLIYKELLQHMILLSSFPYKLHVAFNIVAQDHIMLLCLNSHVQCRFSCLYFVTFHDNYDTLFEHISLLFLMYCKYYFFHTGVQKCFQISHRESTKVIPELTIRNYHF